MAIGQIEEARAILQMAITYQLTGKIELPPHAIDHKTDPSTKILLTHWGSVISYRARTRYFFNADPIFFDREALPVLIKKIKGKEYPYISNIAGEFFISQQGKNLTLDRKPGNIFIESFNHQCVIKNDEGKYLTIPADSEHR